MANRKTPQTKADQAIAKLSAEDRDELTRLCEAHSNVTEIHRWLSERVPGVSYRSVLAWYNREYPPGESARMLNGLMAIYRGINPVSAHTAALSHIIWLSDQLMKDIGDISELKSDKLDKLISLLREQRQSAQALATASRIKDTKALELAGGYRLAEIANRISEGSPYAGAIGEVLKAAIAQLEQEVG